MHDVELQRRGKRSLACLRLRKKLIKSELASRDRDSRV